MKGKMGYGSSARYELSDKIMKGILEEGLELSEMIDSLSGQIDVRSKAGAMGILTQGVLNRDYCYSHGVVFAFAPW
jgi:non-canonical (house-cleaning) NTP pyrophosphatase